MIDLETFAVNPLTLVVLVMFLVQFIKDLGIQGNKLRLISLALGGVLAFAFKARDLWPAALPWIDAAFFVLAVGFGASGGYSLIKQFTGRRYVEDLQFTGRSYIEDPPELPPQG